MSRKAPLSTLTELSSFHCNSCAISRLPKLYLSGYSFPYMPYCRKCGMQYDGAGCLLCGGAGLGKATERFVPRVSGEAALSENVINALCYVLGPVTGMAFLAMSPYNQQKSVRFNALQSILFFCVYVLLLFIAGLFLPTGLRDIVARTIQLTGTVCWLYVMWRTFRGDKVVIPGIGDAAERNS